MINSGSIHYMKSSIRKWSGEIPRIKVNLDLVGASSNKVHKLQWKMTQEKRELFNSLGEDEHWSGWNTALTFWQTIRRERGHGVKLWIGKLHERANFQFGKVQHKDRIEYAVSILALDRPTQQLHQYIWYEDFVHEAEFHDIQNADYNRVWDFRNPLSNKIGTTRSKRIQL